MDQFLQEQAQQYRKNRRRKRWYRDFVRILAGIVVFCTTYALILPAITMERKPVCGYEEHTHNRACYIASYPFQCPQVHSTATILHIHEGPCFDENNTVICPLPEVIPHTHEDACYVITEQSPCTLQETEGHAHGEACWERSESWLCGLAETPPHHHDQNCYTPGTTYICGQEEVPAHIHTNSCYAQEATLSCGLEIQEAHTHTDSCFQQEQILGCGQEEIPSHTHGANCFTVEEKLNCTLPETDAHSHSEGCYETWQETVCTPADGEEHSHTDACYETHSQQVCTQEVTEGHRHGSSCYSETTRQTCMLEETAGHVHTDACYVIQERQICTLTETEGHQHSEGCYSRQLLCQTQETQGHSHTEACLEQRLDCTIPEGTGHSHTDDCRKRLVCTLAEVEPHTHTESCAGGEIRVLNCNLLEVKAHTHDETCPQHCDQPVVESHTHTEQCLMTAEQQAAALICTLPLHVHDETCYEAETLPTEEGFICGFGSHIHGDSCHDETGQLICTIPEHEHNISCVLETYDPTADVESQEDWEATFQHITKTGNWPEDVLAIARTQLGYTESERNCYLYEDGTIRGYTRYGAWYGSPYDDWCAMFVSFCLYYADVEDFPLEAGCNPWADKLEAIGAYHSADNYQPKAGDLVFFDWEGDASLDHVGLVCEVKDDGSIVTIEGNSGNCVRYRTYPAGDITLAGFGQLPEKKPEPQVTELSCQGPDYTVTVTYDAGANLPEDVQLSVREIPQDSAEYNSYYLQAAAALQDPNNPETPVEIPFARFFDISFISNGQTVEPAGPVEVRISYQELIGIAEDAASKAVHFAENGIEVLDTENNASENQADTFSFTQNSFSVTGIVIAARGLDLTGAEELTNYDQSVRLMNEKNEETSLFIHDETFKLEMNVFIYDYQMANSEVKKLRLTLPASLVMTGFTCSNHNATVHLDEATNTVLVEVPRMSNGNGWWSSAEFQLTLTGTAVNTSNTVLTGNVAGIAYSVYNGSQTFSYTSADGTTATLELLGSSMSPDTHTLLLEQIDESTYQNAFSSFVNSNFQGRSLEDTAVFQVRLQSKANPMNLSKIPAAYRLDIRFSQTPVDIQPIGRAVAVKMEWGYPSQQTGYSATHQETAVTAVSLSGTTGELDTFGILSLSALNHNAITYNTDTDAFLRDSSYSAYYNSNSPIGTAGSFHIVAFETANLTTHTNGNVLAKNLNAGSNFGTNGYPDELSYVQNYTSVHSTSASNQDHVLAIGSSNHLELYDNGTRFRINGTILDKPKNVVQDANTDSDPFIDLNRVEAEIRQIGANLAGYEDMYLDIKYNPQDNRIALTDPDAVGILNVTPSSKEVFGQGNIYLDGFRSGHNGSIVINVNCAGYSSVTLPNALVVVDGQIQSTAEVTEFSSGKVVWNFLNASGVTINTNRMTGMVIAPGATVNINQNLNGTVVADVVNVKAESHRTDFTGKIVPKTPEGDEEEPTGRNITIQKIKAGYVGTTLADAQFELQVWNSNSLNWEKVTTSDIITDAKGTFLLKELQENIAYQLIEKKAPTGYVLAEKPFCFWIRSNANATQPDSKPEGFSGTAVDSGGVLNIANEPDETVDTTELTLRKQWEYTLLEPPSRISVDIYQIAHSADGQEVSRTLYKTVNLSQIMHWELTITDLPTTGKDLQGAELTYTYTAEEKPVPGFTASYSENNTEGVTKDTILITNRETGEGYELPETGGAGTFPFTFCGLLLLLLALLYVFSRKGTILP